MEFGLIGESLPYSFSQRIHNLFGIKDYLIKEVSERESLDFLKAKQFKGINVTIPYKQTFLTNLDEIESEALSIGVVNTIVNRNGLLYGYNTDYIGFSKLIEHFKVHIRNQNVLILGTGSTSKTINKYLLDHKVNKVYFASRSKEKGYPYDELDSISNEINIIINTTPYNTYPNIEKKPLISLDMFCNLKTVIDVVYNPFNTSLLIGARKRKVQAINGLYMLVSQAYYSELLFGFSPNKTIDEVYRKLLLETTNIVLIGMPSSGKSTIGKKLAKILNKEFIDTDDLIEQRIQMPISKYLNKDNEIDFRKIEANIIDKISTFKGKVISTGGGSILYDENVDLLKENGILFFVDKRLKSLITSDSRPLIKDGEELEKVFNERKPKYQKAADYILSIEDNDLIIKKILFEMEIL